MVSRRDQSRSAMSSAEKNENGIEVKEFTDIVGGHGPWQLGIFAFIFIGIVPYSFHNMVMTFFAPNIEHWCARPPEIVAANISAEQWKNYSIPMVTKRGGGLERSSCTFYNSSLTNGTLLSFLSTDDIPISCDSWEFDSSFYESTMVNEWNLVCDREWLVSIAKAIFMVGYLTSVPITGQLSDRFGRRPVVITCLCVFLITGHLTLLSTSILMFIVIRYFLAVSVTSFFTVSFVMLMEVIGAEYRSPFCFSLKFGWSLGHLLLAGMAWLTPSWFWLQVSITVPWLSLLCIFWIIPETPRWLLTHGKYSEAEAVLLKAAEKNGKDMTIVRDEIALFIRKASNTEKQTERKENIFDLLRKPALRRITLNIYFCWFIASFIYYAVSWNTNDLGGDPYWTFCISGAVELPSTVIFLYISKVIGRKIPLSICNVAAGLCLLLIIPVPADMTWLKITFSMAGKFFVSSSFDLMYMYTTEVFPTVVRNVGLGSSSFWARIGALIAPFIKQVADVTHPVVPLAVPGALSILSGLLILLLPETKNRKIPDTLEEGEMLAKKLNPAVERNAFDDSIVLEERGSRDANDTGDIKCGFKM